MWIRGEVRSDCRVKMGGRSDKMEGGLDGNGECRRLICTRAWWKLTVGCQTGGLDRRTMGACEKSCVGV